MSRWYRSRERRIFNRANDFLDSSRIMMNTAIETMRCLRELYGSGHEQQRELIAVVILNIRFLNRNLAAADSKFSAWQETLEMEPAERVSSIRCMLLNARKNFDVACEQTEEIHEWLSEEVLALVYSEN